MFVASTATVDIAMSKKAEIESIVLWEVELLTIGLNEDIPRNSASWAYLRIYLCIFDSLCLCHTVSDAQRPSSVTRSRRPV